MKRITRTMSLLMKGITFIPCQPTPHYTWLWPLTQAVNRTSGRSGSTSKDGPAERGCSRSRTTLGSMPTTPGGSHMTCKSWRELRPMAGQAFH